VPLDTNANWIDDPSFDPTLTCHQRHCRRVEITLFALPDQGFKNGMLRHMYGLKKGIDLSFLTGRELIQVAIGVYQVQFGFDEDVMIYVESEFSYFDRQDEYTWKPEPGAAQIAARTVSLLGATIQNFDGQENGTLALAFSNGARLTILDTSQEYESYQITRPGLYIVV
jgi:hypothetical protein